MRQRRLLLLPPVARAEVDALLTRLQTAGCEFDRNGSSVGWGEPANPSIHAKAPLGFTLFTPTYKLKAELQQVRAVKAASSPR